MMPDAALISVQNDNIIDVTQGKLSLQVAQRFAHYSAFILEEFESVCMCVCVCQTHGQSLCVWRFSSVVGQHLVESIEVDCSLIITNLLRVNIEENPLK